MQIRSQKKNFPGCFAGMIAVYHLTLFLLFMGVPPWGTLTNYQLTKELYRKDIIFRSLAHGLSPLPLHPDTS